MSSTSFHAAFAKNMEALGLPAPAARFGNVPAALAALRKILDRLDALGPYTTMSDLVGEGEPFASIGRVRACPVSYYAAAAMGSLARATMQEPKLADVVFLATKHGMARPWLVRALQTRPGFYDPKAHARDTYRVRKAA